MKFLVVAFCLACLFVVNAVLYDMQVVYSTEVCFAMLVKIFLSNIGFQKCPSSLVNHNYNKILKSDWLSTALISALIGQLNRTVRVMPKKLDSTRHHAHA